MEKGAIGDGDGVVNVLKPKPHMPLLAINGLDNDVMLFLLHGRGAMLKNDEEVQACSKNGTAP